MVRIFMDRSRRVSRRGHDRRRGRSTKTVEIHEESIEILPRDRKLTERMYSIALDQMQAAVRRLVAARPCARSGTVVSNALRRGIGKSRPALAFSICLIHPYL